MNRWFYFNFSVLLYAVWKITTGNFGLHIFFGATGLLLILFNWTRHAVFSTIREAPERDKKIQYANLSKRVLPFHKWVGTTALIFILIHGLLIIHQFGLHLSSKKVLTGFIAAIALISLVISGWIRWLNTTVAKRYIHLALGFVVFFMMLIHLFF